MKFSALLVLGATIYAVSAIPSPVEDAADVVIPEDVMPETNLIQFDADFAATKQMLEEMNANGKNDKDCRELADDTEDSVKGAVKAQQTTLEKLDKGQNCPATGMALVNKAKADLDKATAAKKTKTDAYNKAKKTPLDFGKMAYDSLTEGNCGTFFNSQVWLNAKAKVKAARAAKQKAEGAFTQAQKAHADAVEAQKEAERQCYCDVKALHKKTLDQMNVDVKKANEKAWTKAAHIRCVLDGTPMSKCKVSAFPQVKAVKLPKKTQDAKCGPLVKGVNGAMVSCGGHVNGKYKGTVPTAGFHVGTAAGGADPFASYDKKCAAQYGKGGHWCSKAELLKAPISSLPTSWVPSSCGEYRTNGNSWYYLCNNNNGKQWINGKQWKNNCYGQAIPCCK
jgi:hypothetical protein